VARAASPTHDLHLDALPREAIVLPALAERRLTTLKQSANGVTYGWILEAAGYIADVWKLLWRSAS